MQSNPEREPASHQSSDQALNTAPRDSKNHQPLRGEERNNAIEALLRVAQAGDIAKIDKWLERDPTLIDGSYIYGSPLICALQPRNSKTFHHLLARGADSGQRPYDLMETIALHCQWPLAEKVVALEALSKKGVVLNPYLLAALKGKNIALSEASLSARDSRGNNIAHYASASGKLALLQQLKLTHPLLLVNMNNDYADPAPPLSFAVKNGHLEVTKWLLHKGLLLCEGKSNEMKRVYDDALLDAVNRGHLEIVKCLIREAGARTSAKYHAWRTPPLLLAARQGNLPMVQWLVREGGADVSESHTYGDTALLLAAQVGRLEVVKWLVREGGAKLTEKNHRGETALLLAVERGNLPMAQWLVHEGGADIAKKNCVGDTALLVAARKGYLEIMEWLLHEGGAKLTEKNYRGETALLLAAEHRQPHVVEQLIAYYGADPGDGMVIAHKLRTQDDDEVAKAKGLVNLFHEYQHAANNILLEVGSAPNTPLLQELWEIVAGYADVNKEQSSCHKQTQAQNESLLKELKTFSTSVDSSVEWQELSRELVVKICSENSYNASTIHTAVKAFLAVNGEKIAGSKLFEILQHILDKTHALGFPATMDLDKEAHKERKPSAVALPQNLSDRTLSPPPTRTDSAAAKKLIQHLKGLSDIQTKDLAWGEGKDGEVISYFANVKEAQHIMALLKEKHPELMFRLADFSSTSLPTARCYLAVTAPDGITFSLPPAASSFAAISPPSSSSSSSMGFFAEEEPSSQTTQREKKITAETKPANSSAPRDPLYANPLLDEDAHPQNNPAIFSASTTRSPLYANPLLDEETDQQDRVSP